METRAITFRLPVDVYENLRHEAFTTRRPMNELVTESVAARTQPQEPAADHPTKRLKAPDGSSADIDVLIVPLIKALWAAGYETIGSCQDLGESIKSNERKHAYWSGYALIEMPVADTLRLLDEVKGTPQFCDRMHWAAPGAWEVSLPVTPFSMFDVHGEDEAQVNPWAQIRFPNGQIDDLIKVITTA